MLGPGYLIPPAHVWVAPREGPIRLRDALDGDGLALLCFYPWNWSPTCTNELLLLRDGRDALEKAGIRPFAISRDSPWSHAAWTTTLGVDGVSLLSDANGEAARGFGIAREADGIADIPARSAFLIDRDTVRASWLLGTDLPDLDAVIAAASSLSR